MLMTVDSAAPAIFTRRMSSRSSSPTPEAVRAQATASSPPSRNVRFATPHRRSTTTHTTPLSHLPPPWELVDESLDWTNADDIKAFANALKQSSIDDIQHSSVSSTVPADRPPRRKLGRFWARPYPAAANEDSLHSSSSRSIASVTYTLFRIPAMLVIFTIILLELVAYVAIRQIVNIWEYVYTWRGIRLKLRMALRSAKTYAEFKDAALKLDTYLGNDAWRKDPHHPIYDFRLIRRLTSKMKNLRAAGDALLLKGILLQGGIKGNCGGVENRRLYSSTYWGTKELIDEYVHEVSESLLMLSATPDIQVMERLEFFRLASRNYGCTALCLSGGAANGYYHLGVLRELVGLNLLPRIITGTSAGSLMAALVCVRTDAELKELLYPDKLASHFRPCWESTIVWLSRFWQESAIFDALDFATKAQWITLGSTTFLEAYARTGRILNIPAVPLGTSQAPTKLLNYITAPDVVIWSAILASSAIPGVLNPVVLMSKRLGDGRIEPFWGSGSRWRDGSLRSDIPVDALKYYFNVRYTIVSQVNPHVTLFFYDSRGTVGRPSAHLHGRGLRGGFVLASLEHFFKLDLAKYLRLLRDLELLPRPMNQDYSSLFLQRFHGSVTIRPRFSTSAVLRLLSDPDERSMEWYMTEGARSLFGAVRMLENRLRIERSIRRGYGHVKREVAATMDMPISSAMSQGYSGSEVDGAGVGVGISARAECADEDVIARAELEAGYESEDDGGLELSLTDDE